MANVVEIIIKGTNKTKKLFTDTEKSTKSLKDSLKAIAAISVGIGVAGIAVKKAFDLGMEGAIIAQTAESFELLLEKVDAAPDLLDRLSDASRGTISQMDLMSSTATLLAGASGEVATALAEATPQLMEIAKAANKLNPALGDTAFMYNSIATGIKRAQPLILDNLGLVIKVGEANENYAKSIGKTVEQLTAQEKTIAILEGALEAGNVMIDQVGGTTESTADSFLRLTANFQDFSDSLKERVATEFPPLLDALNEYFDTQNLISDAMVDYGVKKKLFLDDFTLEGEVIAKNVDELREWVKAQKEAEIQQRKATEATKNAIPAWHELINEMRAGVAVAEEYVKANQEIITSFSEIERAELAKEALAALNEVAGELSDEEYDRLYKKIAVEIAGMDPAAAEARIKLANLIEELDKQGATLEARIDQYERLGRAIGAIPDVVITGPGGKGRRSRGGGGGRGAEFQSGGTMTVPPGYNQDDFLIGVSSGERVDVTPRGESPTTKTQIFNFYPSSELDAEEMFEQVVQIVSEN